MRAFKYLMRIRDASARAGASLVLLLLFEVFFYTLELFLQMFPVLLEVRNFLLFGEELTPIMTWATVSKLCVIGHAHGIPPSVSFIARA